MLALITVRARIGIHGIPADIVGGGFRGGVHGSKLTLLILDLVLQLLDRARAELASLFGFRPWEESFPLTSSCGQHEYCG